MIKKWLSVFTLSLALLQSAQANVPEKALLRSDVKAFIQEMSDKHGFEIKALNAWFKDTQIKPEIITAITKPAEVLPWHRYEKIFMTQKQFEDGVAFWKKNQKTLERAEKTYGVPAEVIVAIIGVETRYGANKGKHLVLDSLSTLAFTYPPRAAFFRQELEQFLLLSRDNHLNPTEIKGSYAGAMGFPQFISSSYRNFAIPFSNSSNADLINNVDDAIGSVAYYFHKHGWQKDKAVITEARIKNTQNVSKLEMVPKNPKPLYSLSELNRYGVSPKKQEGSLANEKFAFVSFEEAKGTSYWLGMNNFYVITRYNHSHHYAMAVHELSQELKRQMTV